MKKGLSLLCFFVFLSDIFSQDSIFMADPFVFEHEGIFYAYGTCSPNGIAVYKSYDLKNWEGPCGISGGLALHKKDCFGEKNFWAPEVYRLNNKFIMTYTATNMERGQIAVAESPSPLGPFRQENKQPYLPGQQGIDSHIFIDDDGSPYIYWVRSGLGRGNEIRVSQLSNDLCSLKGDQRLCLYSTFGTWERTDTDTTRKVAEAPFVLKHNGLYYLFYSCNHFASEHYSVGYATSSSPMGPWKRYEGNPVLYKHGGYSGTGHHAFLKTEDQQFYIVYHAHYSNEKVSPRRMLISPCSFVEKNAKPETFVVSDEIIIPVIKNKNL